MSTAPARLAEDRHAIRVRSTPAVARDIVCDGGGLSMLQSITLQNFKSFGEEQTHAEVRAERREGALRGSVD